MLENITQERLRTLVRYNPESGIFTWLTARSRFAKPGTVAGTISKKGYRSIMVAGKMYKAHRLAWFYMTGEWPPDQIDHIDGDRDNNRLVNLRKATNAQNGANARLSKNNSSGFKGVSFDTSVGRWRASIRRNRQLHYLGFFNTPEEAHAAYASAAVQLFGEFARMG